MRTYDPPVKDYAFLLRHVIDAEKVLEEVTGGTVGLEDAIDVIEGAGAVVAPIAALNAVGDEIGAKLVDGEVVTPPGFKEAFTSYAEGGWIGLSLPESIGGAGMPRMLGAAADEFLHAANPGVRDGVWAWVVRVVGVRPSGRSGAHVDIRGATALG
jgi:alkylation response protein AidB-like acyl-CoA dehydrogenase